MAEQQTDVFDVAILGGGFAGVYAAKSLAKRLKRAGRKASIAIVSEENYMVFQPMLPEVAGAALSPRHVVNPIRNLCREANVFRAEASDIDLEGRSLIVSAGDYAGSMELRFRQLALCLGAKVDVSRIPGMPEHALLMQNVGDAMRLRAYFIGRFEEANLMSDPELRQRLLTFVVVGGGYSGVETAGQLLDLGRAVHRSYKNIDWEDCRLVLVHSGEHLLPTLHRKLGEYTADKLRERGLEIRLGVRAKTVTANKITLGDGSEIDTNSVVCTVGNAPHPLVLGLEGQQGLELERGRLKVGPDMAAPGLDGLWAAGDCAAIPQGDGGYCPPTAQFAMREGLALGRNIAARILEEETKPFRFKAIGELASIGHLSAVAEIKGLHFSGFFAWWMWRTIYLSKLPGLERKIRVVVDWTLELFFPRDINLLNPRYSSDIAETYLSAGDCLFRKGDPAFSFYIVKSGAIELRDGGERVTVVKASQHFGERALLEGTGYRFDAVAVEATSLVAVRGTVFRQVVRADAAFSRALEQSSRAFLTSGELDALLRRLPQRCLESRVSDYMQREVVAVRQEDTVDEVLRVLRERPKSYLPVLDAEGCPVGALQKESFLLRLQSEHLGGGTKVGDLKLVELPVVGEGDSIRDAMTLLARSSASKALATDGAGRLTGVVALVDVLAGGIREEGGKGQQGD